MDEIGLNQREVTRRSMLLKVIFYTLTLTPSSLETGLNSNEVKNEEKNGA